MGLNTRPTRACSDSRPYKVQRSKMILMSACLFLTGCRSQMLQPKPSIEILRIPSAAAGGPDRTQSIEGRVSGAKPGQQVVLYAKEDMWWAQPFWSRPFTTIQSDSTWKSATHLGSDYAAMLVEPGYHPQKMIAALPAAGNGVVAVAIVKGTATPATALKTIHFSGYDWTVRDGLQDRGGEASVFDPRNVWVDAKGYLHLLMGETDGRWSCSEVKLTRSLGYGTYKFVVQDSAHLSPSAVLGIFTVDERHGEEPRAELDIELSQWAKPEGHNAMYVVQPYYVPENVARFSVLPGSATHTLHWAPKVASFTTVQDSTMQNSMEGSKRKRITEHVFTSSVPTPAGESVHINLYDFLHSRNKLQRPAEVVIEKFEFLP
jgi:hypothetical protein